MTAETPMDDRRNADQAWADATAKGVLRHILPSFWPLAVGVAITLASAWFAGVGLLRLDGVWSALGVVWVVVIALHFVYELVKAQAAVTASHARPFAERQDDLADQVRAITATPRTAFLTRWAFWRDRAIYTLPKGALTTVAFLAWWPLPVAVAVSAIPLLWVIAARFIRDDRVPPAVSMLVDRRGPDGLPTPEI
jgi:hypothetical protein